MMPVLTPVHFGFIFSIVCSALIASGAETETPDAQVEKTLGVALAEKADDPVGEFASLDLEWEPVTAASSYEVELTPKEGGAATVIATPDSKVSRSLPSGVYILRIRSKDRASGYFGPWGAKSEIEARPQKIEASEPRDNAVLSFPKEARARVVFKWKAVAGAKSYVLKVQTDSEPKNRKEFRSAQTTLALNIPTGKLYHWQVAFESRSLVDYVTQPEIHSFTLLGKQLLTPSFGEKTAIAAPRSLIASGVKQLNWVPSPDAQTYRIKISRRNVDENDWHIVAELKQSPEPVIHLHKRLPPGIYKTEIVAQAPRWIDSDAGVAEISFKPSESELAASAARTTK